jgi:alpha-1,2-mannosyltransferase
MLLSAVLAWDGWGLRRLLVDFDHTDFATFYDTGRAWLQGIDLYWSGRGSALNLNPPVTTLAFAPFALMPERIAILLWMAVNGVCLATSLWIVVQELDLEPSPNQTIAGLVWLGLLMPFVQMLWVANLAWLLMLPATLAWRSARRHRDSAAGAWLGLVLALKPIFLLFFPYWVLRRRWSSLAASTGVGIGLLILGLVIFGRESYQSWLAAGRSVSWFADTANVSLLGIINRSVPARSIEMVWYPSLAVLLTVVIFYLSRERTVDFEWALIWCVSLLVSPLGWLYYFALATGPLLATFHKRQTMTLLTVMASMCVPAPVLINIAGSVPGVMWVTTSLAGLSTLFVFVLLIRLETDGTPEPVERNFPA